MGYKYFLPLDYDSVYRNSNAKPFTYDYRPTGGTRHDPGKLDMALGYNGVDIFSMTEGTVVGVGDYGDDPVDPTTYCHILADNKIMGHQAYFRYLHGNFDETLKNKHISRGQKIGTVNTHGAGGYHLHVDIMPDLNHTYSSNGEFMGTLDFENRTFTFEGTTYQLDSNIDLNWIKTWNQQRSDPAENTNIGYCWLIFAQDPQHLTPSVEPEGGIPIDRTAYDNTSGDGVASVADFYFTGIVNEDFCGPPPVGTLTDIQNDPRYEGLRRMVNVCHHEFSGIGRFAFVAFAKLLRAQFCCNLGVYRDWGLNANNLNDMIINVSNSGSGDIGDISLNHDILPSDVTIEEIEAIYNNFRYPNIFGSSLHKAQDGEEYKQLILEGINSLPMTNGFIDDPTSPNYGYTQYHIEAPPYFLVAYNYDQKKAVPNGQLDFGCFIFYRYKNQVNSINPKVQ